MTKEPSREEVIDKLGEVIISALYLAEDSEDIGLPETITVPRAGFERLEKSLDALEEWPDEPGKICGPAAKALWEIKRRLLPSAEAPRDATMVPRPIDEWHEDHSDVLWWCWRDGEWLGEAPYVGSPLDLGQTVECHTHRETGESPAARFSVGGWPGYHTHWTPLPAQPYAPEQSS
tara:strand:+ start:4364 stop:4891 length:528 start_codon:yes stop_codon:yes gene_type:complete